MRERVPAEQAGEGQRDSANLDWRRINGSGAPLTRPPSGATLPAEGGGFIFALYAASPRFFSSGSMLGIRPRNAV